VTVTVAVPRSGAMTTSIWLVRVTAVSCLFGAEAIHSAVIDEHIQEWLPAGLFFLVLSIIEGVLAVTLLTAAPSRRVKWLIVGVSLGTVALWLVSRTLGLPFGHMGGVEPVGRADTVSSVLELVTAVVLLAPATATTWRRRSARDYVFAALIVLAVVALTVFGHSQAP
jgi:hypothetical protein